MSKELLLTNGHVFSGLSDEPRHANILIRNGKIAAIDNIPESTERETIDCRGFTIAPGFIDVHSHSDQEVLHHASNKIMQGITTEIAGNCGFSLFPTKPNPEGVKLHGELFDGEPVEGMATTAEYFDAVEKAGTYVNIAALSGHIPIRILAMGMRRDQPTVEEMRYMEKLLESCLDSGSIGFSTGLNCMPSSFANSEEVIALCKVLYRYGGFYATHMRDYKFRLVEAVDEALQAAAAAEVPVQISHFQAVGKKSWSLLDRALEKIEQSQRQGIDVAIDAYPYMAGCCSLSQFLPDWCQDGGAAALMNRLQSRTTYLRIAAETDDYMSNTWDDLVVSMVNRPESRKLIGKSIAKIAGERGQRSVETGLDLLIEEEAVLWVISFNNNEDNLKKVLTHPLAMVITDGLLLDGAEHPRTFGTYPKFLGEFVREKRWLPLGEALRKTSTLAARRFRLARRGTIEAGNWADIVVFSADSIGSDADYDEPARHPDGIVHVLVNGQLAVRDGRLTGERAGVPLRHLA